MTPPASIVIPTRVRPTYLEVALTSIVPQADGAGVEVLVGNAYSDGASGAAPAGGSADIVVNDSTTGANVTTPVGLAS